MTQVSAGQKVTADNLSLSYNLADTISRTVTQATSTQLSTVYPIAANDPAVGTSYRLTCAGLGVWGSTAQQLNLNMVVGGSTMQALGVASGAFSVSQAFHWRIVLEMIFTSIGSAGTCNNSMALHISPSTASATNCYAVARFSTANPVNTAVSNAFQLSASWAATTGAPTITCAMTTFEKLGG